MSNQRPSRLRFNFGFMLEATLGTSRKVELGYPTIQIAEDVILTPLEGTFEATRTSEGIYLSGLLTSKIPIECVRCLDEFNLPIQLKIDDLFYYPPHTAPPGEYTVGEDGFLDLAPLVREISLLEIPMQPFCKPDCKGLCSECGQNLNEASCNCAIDDIDPRMAALRQLLDE
ncbi:MAG: DUF177 domain-containing protein [Anaerolineales bacterium]|nr:DUF177 domain-containing protein [Anaerolineales bacterium]